MVKKLSEVYMCEICNNVYDTEDLARQCERSHIEYVIEPVFSIGEQYPVELKLLVKEKDKTKTVVIYTRSSVSDLSDK